MPRGKTVRSCTINALKTYLPHETLGKSASANVLNISGTKEYLMAITQRRGLLLISNLIVLSKDTADLDISGNMK